MLSPLAVLAQVAIWAGAEVLVRLSIDAGTPVDTGVVAATVVQVFVTEQATPVKLEGERKPKDQLVPSHGTGSY